MSASSELQLTSPGGLSAVFHANGTLHRLDFGDTSISLFAGNALEAAATALWLRRRQDGAVRDSLNLLSPASGAQWRLHAGAWQARGSWGALRYQVRLQLHATAPVWSWHVDLHNAGDSAQTVDLVLLQDVALAPYGAVRTNEYYVSQYLDHVPLDHPLRGTVLATRQNLAGAGGRHPWLLVGSLRRAVGHATDALQSIGLGWRSGAMPTVAVADLPNQRLQHEHAMLALQDEACVLAAHADAHLGFFAGVQADHPGATGTADLAQADAWAALAAAVLPMDESGPPWREAVPSLFTQADSLPAQALSEARLAQRFSTPWRQVERDADGRLLSFFAACGTHVALPRKERQALRPHGQLLRTGAHLVPDERSLTSTCWMGGVFHSMVTEGHVSINRLLSTVRSTLGLNRGGGQRVLVDIDGQWQLLGQPSAFAMSDRQCQWIYAHADGELTVSASAAAEDHGLSLALQVDAGPARRFLVTHHLALQGDDGLVAGMPVWQRGADGTVTVAPAPGSAAQRQYPGGSFSLQPDARSAALLEHVGADELLYLDGQSRGQPFLCLRTLPCTAFGLALRSHLLGPLAAPDAALPHLGALRLPQLELPQGAAQPRLAELAEWLPWLQNNALVHYLAPRGLEQYTGGGWGTRDVSQGPVELLLAHGRLPPLRDLLLRVFAEQQPDGDWPQWFMFFARDRHVRAGDSHGDIVFWPLVALGQYLQASGDGGLLDERLPFFHTKGPAQAEQATVWQHVQRALGVVAHRRIPATQLAAYGHGDWNDSLQPADPRLRERLCSAWTVTLHYQMLRTLGQALQSLGRTADGTALLDQAQAVLHDLQQQLMPDGVLAGYALFEKEGAPRYLLHPRDEVTGAHYSLLPMVHAVIHEMLDPAQAAQHLALVRAHLLGPDGARLFDRPLAYRGGPQTLFQRAESSSFFGREIGLMYTHAHLRYAEALAQHGDAQAFFEALCQVNPIGMQAWLPQARPRQANCYYSSSDAEFADRYEAAAQYDRLLAGEVGVQGGWRVYSSGAGIALSLVVRQLLGLRGSHDAVHFDPVMPQSLDGLVAQAKLRGTALEVRYRVGPRGCGVQQLTLNGQALAFTRLPNRYRPGVASVALQDWTDALAQAAGGARLEIVLG
jgi:CRISPR-associated protein Csx3